MPTVFQKIYEQLDLKHAVRQGSQRNDLLPPRYEDSVLGEVGNRFSESLQSKLERGKYEPTPAATVHVPKPGNTTRPAALLTLSDRVLYDAIVATLRPRIETGLLGAEITIWPRGHAADKAWDRFERCPLDVGLDFVARADITGFYESIDHERLRDVLIDLTGRRHEVNALIEFLSRVMQSTKGVPQGLDASDPLATAFLSSVDAHMARSGVTYFRHGDDIRICSSSRAEARSSLFEFERSLREVGLLVNSTKSIIMTLEDYKALLQIGIEIEEGTRTALSREIVSQVDEYDEDEITRLIDDSGDEELGWAFFYHMAISFEQLIEALQDTVKPEDAAIALKLLVDALDSPIGTDDGISKEEFHYQAAQALVRLAAGKSPLALPHLKALLSRSPEKTSLAANYLMALDADHADEICRCVFEVIESDRFFTAWETTWLLRVLQKYPTSIGQDQVAKLHECSLDEDQEPIVRVEALKILGRLGSLDQLLVRRLWNSLSPVYKPDLLAAVFFAKESAAWCEPFLDAAKEDAICVVVLRHLENEHAK
jgi:hypothetical protein